jgi:hypothetical protein
VCLGLWLGGGEAAAQSVRLDTHLSTDSVVVGERFTVSFVASHAPGVDVSFPAADAGPVVFGTLEVLDRSAVANRSGRGALQVDSVAYTVATFALDSVRVPSVPVQVMAGGDTTIAATPARTATVVSVVGPDAKGIHGVASPAPFPRPLWTWIVLGLAAAALLAGLAYLWWRRRDAGEAEPARGKPAVDQTPYEAATSWIRQLESYDLADPDAVKPFYVELSTALRVYLARELGVAALERTTREVIDTLEHRPDVPGDATARMRAVLELADLVKFADARPSTDDHEKALEEARTALDTIEAAPRLEEGGARPYSDGRGRAADGASRPGPPEGVDGVASATTPDSASD